MKNWKRRYFVLTSNALTYYDSDLMVEPAKGKVVLVPGTRLLTQAECREAGIASNELGLKTQGRVYVLRPESERDRIDWKAALRTATGTESKNFGLKAGKMYKVFIFNDTAILCRPVKNQPGVEASASASAEDVAAAHADSLKLKGTSERRFVCD